LLQPVAAVDGGLSGDLFADCALPGLVAGAPRQANPENVPCCGVACQYDREQRNHESPKEQATIRDSVLDEIVVYGKIPRRSIQVPVYFGGTTSPGFMYVIKTANCKMSLNFIVETKDVNSKVDLRGTEGLRIKAARKFFELNSGENVSIHFVPQLKPDDISHHDQIICSTISPKRKAATAWPFSTVFITNTMSTVCSSSDRWVSLKDSGFSMPKIGNQFERVVP
ncbi:restriction endonuclease, partial [Corynebacterium propinquum]